MNLHDFYGNNKKINLSEGIPSAHEVEQQFITENLHKWFKEKWVRFGPDGKIRGDCARGDDSEGKPKCLPRAKAHSLGKKGRKYAASKKRREDPNPERSGSAINVATKKKANEGTESCPHCGGPIFEFTALDEGKDACYYKVKSRYKVWPSAYASGALVKCRKKGAKNWGNKSESVVTEADQTFGQAFSAARAAAAKTGDPASGSFQWKDPKTGKTATYQTNIAGEKYVVPSQQRPVITPAVLSPKTVSTPSEMDPRARGLRSAGQNTVRGLVNPGNAQAVTSLPSTPPPQRRGTMPLAGTDFYYMPDEKITNTGDPRHTARLRRSASGTVEPATGATSTASTQAPAQVSSQSLAHSSARPPVTVPVSEPVPPSPTGTSISDTGTSWTDSSGQPWSASGSTLSTGAAARSSLPTTPTSAATAATSPSPTRPATAPITPANSSQVAGSTSDVARQVREKIARAESGNNPNITYGDTVDRTGKIVSQIKDKDGKPLPTAEQWSVANLGSQKKLEDMTASEALRFARARDAAVPNTGAVGAYQFRPSTLQSLLNKMNVNSDRVKFDKNLQDRLYDQLLSDNRDYIKREGITPDSANTYMTHMVGAPATVKIYRDKNDNPNKLVADTLTDMFKSRNQNATDASITRYRNNLIKRNPILRTATVGNFHEVLKNKLNPRPIKENAPSKLYFNVIGTDKKTLVAEFNMRRDVHGWYLPEGTSTNQKLDAYRAFGNPLTEEELNAAGFSGTAATLGVDNPISPIGSVSKSQRINKKARSK